MKNIQLKITIILIIISSILLSGVSLINLYNFNKIVSQNNSSEITQIIGSSKTVLEITWVVSIILFSIFAVVFVNKILKMVTDSFSDIVDNSGKFMDENEEEIKYLDEGKKSSEDKFTKTINTMTEELKQNLDVVNKQKNQTEAILLHIKDGIISVDLKGNVTYINPAAINFFELTIEDNTFEKIFNKIGLDVNLEKIVYLDDLTSSEQKVYINGKIYKYIFCTCKKLKKYTKWNNNITSRYNRACKVR